MKEYTRKRVQVIILFGLLDYPSQNVESPLGISTFLRCVFGNVYVSDFINGRCCLL